MSKLESSMQILFNQPFSQGIGGEIMAQSVKIFGFVGRLHRGSYNKALMRAASELLPENAKLEVFDLE